MRATGIVRKLDQLGRVVIPKELKSTRWAKGEERVEIYLEDDIVVIENPEGKVLNNASTIRSFDLLGRIVLPSEMRKYLNFSQREPLEIYTDGDKILLKKYKSESSCVFCENITDSVMFRGKVVCVDCLGELSTHKSMQTT